MLMLQAAGMEVFGIMVILLAQVVGIMRPVSSSQNSMDYSSKYKAII